MKRIILMVVTNLFFVIVCWPKLCRMAAHPERYTKERALEASAVLGRTCMQGRENCIRSPRSGKTAGGTVYSVPEPSGNV